MFTKLNKVLDDMDIHIVIKKKNDILTVSVLPKNEKLDKLKITPIFIKATPEELDQTFADVILSPLNEAIKSTNTISQFEADLKEKTAAKTTEKKPTTPTAKTDNSKTTKNKPETKIIDKPKPVGGITLFDALPENSTSETPLHHDTTPSKEDPIPTQEEEEDNLPVDNEESEDESPEEDQEDEPIDLP